MPNNIVLFIPNTNKVYEHIPFTSTRNPTSRPEQIVLGQQDVTEFIWRLSRGRHDENLSETLFSHPADFLAHS